MSSGWLQASVDADDHVLGSDSAPITIVEYGDYECPYCRRAATVVKLLREPLGDLLRFVFRNFPLAIVHRHALIAAEAAEAAGAQGLYWRMHEMLYDNQEALAPAHLLQYAARVGLEPSVFEYDLRTHRYLSKVAADLRSGVASGVSATPTFFINGSRHDGGHDFESLSGAIAGVIGFELGA